MAFGGRFYTHDGRKKPSVTTITGLLDKPALVQWAANCTAEYILDAVSDGYPTGMEWHEWILNVIEAAKKNYRKVSSKAMDIGSACHAAIERYLNTGQEPEAPSDEVMSTFIAFLDWMSEHKLVTIQPEQTVYSDLYAGTTDLVAMLDGKKYVVDFKTFSETAKTQPPYPEAKYQVAAYRNCIEGVEGTGILYLGKSTGKMKWIDTSASYETDLAIFNHLVEVYYLIHKELRRE